MEDETLIGENKEFIGGNGMFIGENNGFIGENQGLIGEYEVLIGENHTISAKTRFYRRKGNQVMKSIDISYKVSILKCTSPTTTKRSDTMKLRNMTIDELLDLEQELLTDTNAEQEPIGRNHQIISVYEELYKKISKDKDGEYADLEPMIKKNLVSFLVRHGSYLKTEYQKDDRAAESTLKKALTYNRQIPIAYYRLGFLAYKQKNYLQALLHFKNAQSYNQNGDNKQFHLTDQQHYHAQIYIANSSLHIAKAAQEKAARLEEETDVLTVPSQNLSPLYELIANNEKRIEQNAYKIITEEGEKLCSKDQAEDLLETEQQKIILYFSDRENMLLFNGKSKPLATKQAELLRYLFLYTSNQHPATKHHVYNLYEGKNDNGEMPTNTYTQWIARLKEKLTQCHIPSTIINNTRYQNQTAYFFEKNWPFILIHRSDDTFIL